MGANLVRFIKDLKSEGIMRVTLVRHGQSKGNFGRFFPNHTTELTDVGHKQAKKVMDRLNGSIYDGLFSSPLNRALQTAKYLSENLNLPITQTPLLAELRDPSIYEGKDYTDEKVAEIKAEIARHLDDIDYHYSDEENYFEFIERGKKLLEFFEKLPFENIVCVSHGYLISMITLLVVFADDLNPSNLYRGMRRMHSYNTAISVIEFQEGIWRLYSFGDHAHLLGD